MSKSVGCADDSQSSIRELERKVFDYFTLLQLGKSLISIHNMQDLAHALVSSVYDASDAENVALLIYDIDSKVYEYKDSIGFPKGALDGLRFVGEEGLLWRVLNGGEPFAIRDSLGHDRFETAIKRYELERLDSVLWVPLMLKNKLHGILTLGEKNDGNSYADRDLNFLSHLATQAVVAIDSVLVDQQKQRTTASLGLKMQNLSVLYDVSRALNFANDLKKTLLLILDKARGAVDAQKGSIMLLDDGKAELEIKVVRGIDPVVERQINDGEVECTKINVGEGIAGKVVKTGRYMVVDDVSTDSNFKKSDRSNVENIICIPLTTADAHIGVMNITNKKSGERFSENDIDLLIALAGQAAITINNANLYHLAITDGLTQLFINRYFRQKLEDELRRSKRYSRNLSLIMMDIDHFKTLNDTYGHQQGDDILAATARIMRNNVRETDIPCRYGGEEFAVILPETDAKDAIVLAERLRKGIENYDFSGPADEILKVTISLGIASVDKNIVGMTELIELADKAMYASKKAGRNRVTVDDTTSVATSVAAAKAVPRAKQAS
ncbi:MAG: sensor domain-containing diguanylate cyclase [Gammaproteobacteria bacterium]|nr:sensor domain-containing diguanylate cyclase [Gammaproteobacteria bacterium]MDH3464801.1 sensor domain-containing diguanylate cyclase [Gammaproteobacteria bacterium]